MTHRANNSAWEVLQKPLAQGIVKYLRNKEQFKQETTYSQIRRRFNLKNGNLAYILSLMERTGIIVSTYDSIYRKIRLTGNFKADQAREKRGEPPVQDPPSRHLPWYLQPERDALSADI